MADQDEVDRFFESAMPGPETQRLFDAAAAFEMGFYLGYAERIEADGAKHHYNTSILVDQSARIVPTRDNSIR